MRDTSQPHRPSLVTKFKTNLNAIHLLRPRRMMVALAALLLIAVGVTALQIRRRALERLALEKARLERENIVPFERKIFSAIDSKAISIWQSYKTTRAIARFNDSYFVATDGGLVELSTNGDLKRHYTVLDGLPESDLLSLATFNSSLFIGTRTQGLVTFDGERFTGYRWTDRTSQSVDALFTDNRKLLIGTRAGGLLEFDGRLFKEIKIGPERKRLLEVNLISRNGTRLFIGTFADGLWMQEGGRWSHFTSADGLLSNRTVGVAIIESNLIVASDFGLATGPLFNLDDAQSSVRFHTLTILPSLSSMAQRGNAILVAKDNGESFTVSGTGNRQAPLVSIRIDRSAVSAARFATLDQNIWMLSSDGLRRAQSADERSDVVINKWGKLNNLTTLESNLITALSIDSQGRIWAGTFRNGIDVLSSQGNKLAHLETTEAREINSLSVESLGRTILAATSAGLFRFDESLHSTEHVSTNRGLISNSVLQVSNPEPTGSQELVCATSKGLAIGPPTRLRSLTTVQGLPSNSLYSVVTQGRRIYAGTLGGLAVIDDGHVTQVFKDTNSKLTHNWITGLCAVGDRLFIGTYGGGVFELDHGGDVRPFPDSGRAVVNPNAMWSDGSRLFVGTLDGALVFDLNSQRWTKVRSELPSRMVLSITGDEKFVYFGTSAGIARIARSYFNDLESMTTA